MPGVLAGIFGALMAGLATEASYDYSLYEVRNSVALIKINFIFHVINSYLLYETII